MSKYSAARSESTTWKLATDLKVGDMIVEGDGYLWNILAIKDMDTKLELSLRNDFSMMNNKPKQIIKKNCKVLCMKPENTFDVYNPSIS